MSLRSPKVRRWLGAVVVLGAVLVVLGALQMTPAASPLQAQGTATPGGCSPYDSGCFYCQNHPTSSVCTRSASGAATEAATATPTGTPTATPTSQPLAAPAAAALATGTPGPGAAPSPTPAMH